MKMLLITRVGVATAVALGASLLLSPSSAQPAKATGHWAFVDVTEKNFEEKHHNPVYPGSVSGTRGALHTMASCFDRGKTQWKVESDWTWTDPPGVMVPGDLVTLRLSYKGGPGKAADPGRGDISADICLFELGANFRALTRMYPKSFLEADGVMFKKGFNGEWCYGLTNLGIRKTEGEFIPENSSEYIGKVQRYRPDQRPSHPGEWISLRVHVNHGRWRTYYYNYKWIDGPPPKDGIKIPPVDGPETTPETPIDPKGTGTVTQPPGVTEPATTTKFTVQAGVRRAKPGEIVQVPVFLLNPGGVANLNTTISYTPAVAAAEGKPLRGNVLGTSLFEANASEAGIARVGFAGSKPLTDSGTLAHITFKAVGKPGDRTVLKVAVTIANSSDGKPMTAETIDGEVIIVGEGGKIIGDHDGDGVITASDALAALKMSVKLITEDLNLDMDKDAKVTSNDARVILLKAVGK